MTDRPILFSGQMVRALLDGRKTQTRRVITKKAAQNALAIFGADFLLLPGNVDLIGYAPGDQLWVRERFAVSGIGWGKKPSEARGGKVHFHADNEHGWHDHWGSWRPSIHMPRWASRLTLTVTDVRVQRLQDIRDADCRAEGCSGGHDSIPGYGFSATPGEHFRWLWDSLNAERAPWDSNPWVCTVSFSVHKCNIDQVGEAA